MEQVLGHGCHFHPFITSPHRVATNYRRSLWISKIPAGLFLNILANILHLPRIGAHYCAQPKPPALSEL